MEKQNILKVNALESPPEGGGGASFLETINIQNGVVQNLRGHVARMCETARHFGFTAPNISKLETFVPKALKKCLKVKCRIIYHTKINEITFEEYTPKTITSLKLVEGSPDYSFKFTDRTTLNHLLSQKGDCDEVLIVRNGCITDTSFSNVVFRRKNRFFTPDTYILNGTQRQLLLHKGAISERRIMEKDLDEFDEMLLINAMLSIGSEVSQQEAKIVICR